VAHAGSFAEAVHELLMSNSLVDVPGPLALELVRQAAGAQHHHPFVARPGCDRPADRLAQPVTARRRRQGHLDGVHADRDRAHRPLLIGPAQGHRQGERVIDHHLLAGGEVEFVMDQRLDQMPGQGRVTPERRHGRDAPSLVGVAIVGCRPHRESRHLVEKKIQAMVVVDNHGHLRPDPCEPLAHRHEPVEERLPVRVLLQALGNGRADGRDVRGGDGTDNPGHGVSLARPAAWP
jgi:hypothetical protein